MLFLALVSTTGWSEFIVAIDPGHGGKDAGALGENTNEKSVNLAVALELRDLLAKQMKDARVIMTRDDDTFIPLQTRADIANRKKANIFVSIHANSVDKKNPRRSLVQGASVYTLGLQKTQANLEVAMRENAVMKLEKDYRTTYQGFDPNSAESYIMFELMQHANIESSLDLANEVEKELVRTASRANSGIKQAPFWVLVRTSMPAILVELDFICNPEQEAFLNSKEGQAKLAKAIFNGIKNYRNSKVSKQ